MSDTRGSAGWMSASEAAWRGLFRKDGLLIGDWQRGSILPVRFSAINTLTIGAPGSMKGTGMLIPNALTQSHIFLTDYGGEITATSINAWREKGYKVYVINPWAMHAGAPYFLPSHSFNPYKYLDPEATDFTSVADLIGQMLVIRSGNEQNRFFDDKTEGGFSDFNIHIRLTEEEKNCNLVTLRKHVMADAGGWKKLLNDMKASRVQSVRDRANEWERMGAIADNREFSSIRSSMEQATRFLRDSVIGNALGSSDVDLSDLKGERGCIVSLVIPIQFKESHAAFSRLVLACLALEMEKAPVAKHPVLFMLDEFGSMGKVDKIRPWLATLRKYKVRFLLVFQSIGQMQEIYGKVGAGLIEDLCDLRQFMSAWGLLTSTHVSQMCGTTTVTDERGQETARPLVFPEEVRQMKINHQIVFAGNSRPMLLKIRPYWERPELYRKFFPNPFFGDVKAPLATLVPEAFVGGFIRLASSWLVKAVYFGLLAWGFSKWLGM